MISNGLARILSCLCDIELRQLEEINPNIHIKSLLLNLEKDFFSENIRETLDWSKSVELLEKFMTLNGIDGGLDVNKENLENLDLNGTMQVINQFIAIYWAFNKDDFEKRVRVEESDPEINSIINECIRPYVEQLKEEIYLNFARVSIKEKMYEKSLVSKLATYERKILQFEEKEKEFGSMITDYISEIVKYENYIKEKDQEIEVLTQLKDMLSKDIENLNDKKKSDESTIEGLQKKNIELENKFNKLEEDFCKLNNILASDREEIKNYRNQEMIFHSKAKDYEEALSKLTNYNEMLNNYELIKTNNEELKQFITLLHSRNKDLQEQIRNQVEKILESEKQKNDLDKSLSDALSNIHLMENKCKRLENENFQYKNYNRNLLINDMVGHNNSGSKPQTNKALDDPVEPTEDSDNHLKKRLSIAETEKKTLKNEVANLRSKLSLIEAQSPDQEKSKQKDLFETFASETDTLKKDVKRLRDENQDLLKKIEEMKKEPVTKSRREERRASQDFEVMKNYLKSLEMENEKLKKEVQISPSKEDPLNSHTQQDILIASPSKQITSQDTENLKEAPRNKKSVEIQRENSQILYNVFMSYTTDYLQYGDFHSEKIKNLKNELRKTFSWRMIP